MIRNIKAFIKFFIPEYFLQLFREHKKRALKKRLNLKLVKQPDLEFLGTDYSGYPVPMSLINESSICYCIGVGEEISFEQILFERLSACVVMFDPTPRSIKFAKDIFVGLGANISNEDDQFTYRSFHFYPYGIWNENADVKMFAPKDEEHVSHSILNMQHTEDYFIAKCITLNTAMEKLGHNRIDLLKLNVEGAEYAILDFMLQSGILPTVLCVAFDEFHTQIDDGAEQRIKDCLQKLYAVGYEPVYLDNSRITFCKK